ncbi:hypothetical protein [Cupriavidus alkaliphilus]|uniref:hypothetical protein n=1 Tax=Cupriavidus alkaliphilus TaxID=942866 RepID=UPI001617F7A3|nr:hypothetical protein [Cupriavidus alkaliphilus]MBB3016883.1 hypothetical protein [Cupriavidus alkaliphilus]
MFENADDLRAYFDAKKEQLEEVVEHATEALRYLGVAHDYLEEAMDNDWDDETWLPKSSTMATDLQNRIFLISDRIAYREEERDRASDKLDRIDEDMEWEMDAHGFTDGQEAI